MKALQRSTHLTCNEIVMELSPDVFFNQFF